MNKKLSLLAAVSGVLALASALSAADAAAPAAAAPAASGSATAKPAAATASASASTPAASGGTAAKPDLSKLPAPSDKKDIAFDKDIAPILKASCSNCHGGPSPKAKFDVTSKDTLLKGGSKGKDIVPGHSDQSLVVLFAGDTIAKSEMPPLRNRTGTPPIPALTKDQLALLRAWIDQGAK